MVKPGQPGPSGPSETLGSSNKSAKQTGVIPDVVSGKIVSSAPREQPTGGTLRSPCMNSKILSVLGGDPTLRRLIFYNIDAGDFTIANVPNGNLDLVNLDMIWIFNQIRLPRQKLDLRDTLTIAEGLMSYIPNEWKLTTEDARTEFCNTFAINWKDICTNSMSVAGVTHVYDVFAGHPNDPWNENTTDRPTTIPKASLTPAAGQTVIARRTLDNPTTNFFNPDILMALLKLFVEKLEGEGLLLRGRGLAPSLIIGFSKRGSITVPAWNKITRELSTSHPALVSQMDKDRARSYYISFGSLVNDSNIGPLFELWHSLIPGEAIRFKVTIDQAKGSGLTGIDSFQRAYTAYPKFPWYKIRRLYPQEFSIAVDAMMIVGGNPYYGFRADLGIVKSTNYPGVVYTSMQLLIIGLGDKSLTSYGGAKNPAHKFTVDNIIQKFFEGRVYDIDLESQPLEAEITEMGRLKMAAENFTRPVVETVEEFIPPPNPPTVE